MDSHCAPGDRLPSWRVRVLTVAAIAVLTAFNVSGRYDAGRANALLVLAVARGRTNAEVGAELFMSVATVKAHISHILTKLDLTNRTQIALLAHDAGVD